MTNVRWIFFNMTIDDWSPWWRLWWHFSSLIFQFKNRLLSRTMLYYIWILLLIFLILQIIYLLKDTKEKCKFFRVHVVLVMHLLVEEDFKTNYMPTQWSGDWLLLLYIFFILKSQYPTNKQAYVGALSLIGYYNA